MLLGLPDLAVTVTTHGLRRPVSEDVSMLLTFMFAPYDDVYAYKCLADNQPSVMSVQRSSLRHSLSRPPSIFCATDPIANNVEDG